MKRLLPVSCLLLAAVPALAQAPLPETPGIQDNSFLVEEAYNQEPGVVQHISSFLRSWDGRNWVYTFTQEWPVRGQRHQLSGTAPFQEVGTPASAAVGVGDVALNYRLQWIGNGEARVACAPRLSLFVPTGDFRKKLGAGGVGYQVSLPLSVVVSKRVVTHWNAGATLVPSARDAAGDKATTAAFNLGQSLIWLVHRRLNFMLETVWARVEETVAPGIARSEKSLILSPGLRWAYNFESGLQVVPGIAVPLGLGPSRGDNALLLYLSFEHPFRRRNR